MAFEGLSDKLAAAFKRLRSKGTLTESDVRDAMREVRLALLEADVNYKVAKDFTAAVTARAVGAQVMESLTPAQMVTKIVNEEMTALMGGEASQLARPGSKPPCVIMMCGLQGSFGQAGQNAPPRRASPVAGRLRRIPSRRYPAAAGGGRAGRCAGV